MNVAWRGTAALCSIFAMLASTACGPVTEDPRVLDTAGPPAVPASSPSPSPSQGVLTLTPVPQPPPSPPAALAAPAAAKVGPSGAQLAAAPRGAAAGKLRAGVVVPVQAIQNGWARILTPCELTKWVPVSSVSGLGRPQVVLDPGHGGNEPGAVGRGGLAEKTVNLDIANQAVQLLASRGITAIVTRTDDYRATLNFRTDLAAAARPEVLISIHHNAEPDGPADKPGSETFYQIGSPASKRLAGLMYEEAIRVLSPLGARWVADRDAGAKWRPNSSGGDYYGILRRAREKGLTAILAELAFVSNPSEEALLNKPETRNLEAEAVAQAVTRYLRSRDPGSGFTTPYPRKEPAGSGGGRTGCVDPG